MSSDEFDALLAEMEPEIKSAEGDLRAIEVLENKDVLSAGKLTGLLPVLRLYYPGHSSNEPSDYEPLLPRLERLVKLHEEDSQTAAALEKKVASILERYATQVSLSLNALATRNSSFPTGRRSIRALRRLECCAYNC